SPTCAGISPLCQDAIQPRSPRAQSPTNCAGCACTALSSARPGAAFIALPALASASPCSAHELTTVSCAPAWQTRSPASPHHYALSSAPSIGSPPQPTRSSTQSTPPHTLDPT